MWADVLGTRTGECLKRGLRKLRESPPAYPPGAAAFNRLCAEYQPGTFSGGAPRPLPAPATLLENATVRGDARAYLDMCRRVIDEGGLTRAELETLPPGLTGGGHIVRPRDYCTAVDDEGFVKGEKQPHPERCA